MLNIKVKCAECGTLIEVTFVSKDYSKVICDDCTKYEYTDGEEDFLNNQEV